MFSVINSFSFWQSVLPYVSLSCISKLWRVSREVRSCILADEYIENRIVRDLDNDDILDCNSACIDMDLRDVFVRCAIPRCVDYDDYYTLAKLAVMRGNVEYLVILMPYLYERYDWEDACYDDFTFEFMKDSVILNMPCLCKYLLGSSADYESSIPVDVTEHMLMKGFETAVEQRNVSAAKYFLNYNEGGIVMPMYNEHIGMLVKLNSNSLFDANIGRIVVTYHWYTNCGTVNYCLLAAISNDNGYLAEKVLELSRKHGKDEKIVKQLKHTYSETLARLSRVDYNVGI